MDEVGRVKAFRAAAQNRRVAALEAEGAGIRRHAGTALVDDADDAERHGDTLDLEAVGAVEGGHDATDGVGQRRDGVESVGDAGDPALVEKQAIHEGGRGAALARLAHVAGVGGEDRAGLRPDRRGGDAQRLGPVGIRRERQRPAGGAGLAAKIDHQRGDVGLGGVDAFQLFHAVGRSRTGCGNRARLIAFLRAHRKRCLQDAARPGPALAIAPLAVRLARGSPQRVI